MQLQAEVALQQKDEELEQLKEVINKLINEAGARTRKEVRILVLVSLLVRHA